MLLFVINPLSGNRQALSLWNQTERELQKLKIHYASFISNSETDTRQFLIERIQSDPVKAVAVIGGDGTVNSVIQELAGTNIALAILPAGSGNDAARMFGLTTNPKGFIKKLVQASAVSIDLLTVNNRFGITIAGAGLDAAVGQRVNRASYKTILNKFGAGSVIYIIAAIATLLTFKPFQGQVTVDGDTYKMKRVWLTAFGNTTSYGSGLTVCPHAHPMDGFLHVTMLHGVSRMTILCRLFPALLRGRPILHKGVTYLTGNSISVQTNRQIAVVLDGENITSTPLTINIHERALRLILTAES